MGPQAAGAAALVLVAVAATGYGRAAVGLVEGGWSGFRRPWAGRRSHFGRGWVTLVVGLGVLGHLLLLAGLVGLFSIGVIRGVLAVGVGFGIAGFAGDLAGSIRSRSGDDPQSGRRRAAGGYGRTLPWLGGVAGIASLVLLIPAAGMPPLAYDVLEYHLQAPRLFLAERSLEGDAHNFFTRLPMETELIYAAGHGVVAPSVEDDRAAKWLAAGLTVLFAWGCGVLARRMGGRRAARWGAVILGAALPLTGKVALDAFSDGAAAVFTLLMIYGFLGVAAAGPGMAKKDGERASRLVRRRSDLAWAAIGGGLAVSCKWGVLPHLVVPACALILVFTLRDRGSGQGMKTAALFGVGVLLVFSPWMIRATLTTGNPVFPWAASVFPSTDWGSEQGEFLVETHQPVRPWEGAYWVKVWEGVNTAAPVVEIPWGRAEEESPARRVPIPVGMMVVAVGFGLAWRRRAYLAAGILGGLAVLAWATVRQTPDRFLLPAAATLVPAAAVAAEMSVRRWRTRPGRRAIAWAAGIFLAVAVVQDGAGRMALYSSAGYFRALGNPLVGEAAREEILGRAMLALQGQAARESIRGGGKFLILYEARGLLFPLPHELNTVFDRSVLLDAMGEVDSPEAIDRMLMEKGYSHIIINEFELDRLVRFYAPLDREEPVPPREALRKEPAEPYPLMELYRPYAFDARFAQKEEAIRAWHRRVLERAQWRFVGSTGLILAISPVGR